MRVLAIVNNFPWPRDIDGIFNLRQLLAVKERGHDVRVVRCVPFAPPLGKRWKKYADVPKRYEVEGIDVTTLRAIMPPRSRWLGAVLWQTRPALGRIVREFAPDVVHVHGLLPAGVLALGTRVPFVVTAHGSEAYILPWSRPDLTAIARRVVHESAQCAAVSGFVASQLRRLGAESPRVIFNGADERVFRPRDRFEVRDALGLAREVPTILFAGHLNDAKGIPELQDAIVRMKNVPAQCVIAGRGPREDELRTALEAAGIPARFTGVLRHEDLATYIAASDVLVLPSHAEGLPTTICEAMNAGRSVVATRVGGIPEIVEDGVTGFTIDVGDVTALTDRIARVLSDASLRDRFEKAALAFAHTHLTWRVNAAAYEELYRSAVERARRPYGKA